MGPQLGHDGLVVPLAEPTKNWIGLRANPASMAIGSQVLRSSPLRSPRMTVVAFWRCSVR